MPLEEGSAAAKKAKKAAAAAAAGDGKGQQPTLLEDERFAAMFNDPAFAIDERSVEWKQLHPNTGGCGCGGGCACVVGSGGGGWGRW